MENILEFACVPIIATIVYWAINLYKILIKNNEKGMRFIPLISAFLGIALGIVCFYAVPGVIVARNVLEALCVGAASGLSSVGVNQVFKQLTKPKLDPTDTKKTEDKTTKNDDAK